MDVISQRIQKLTREAEDLVNKKNVYEREIQNIEIRLTQVVGAINELKDMQKEIGDAEGKDGPRNDSKS